MTKREETRLRAALGLEAIDEPMTLNEFIKEIRWLRKMVDRGDQFVRQWEK